MFSKRKRRSADWQDDAYEEWENPFDLFIDCLIEHPLLRFLVTIVLSVSAGLATTVLLVFLRTAGYIP